ncbi:unnamed protein product [Lasius platythorax]|uniref:Uncharacterized protein n=1 Tax=Lasius platythorax TaxID=488582 RepID=A0AAV2NHH6_9HYME
MANDVVVVRNRVAVHKVHGSEFTAYYKVHREVGRVLETIHQSASEQDVRHNSVGSIVEDARSLDRSLHSIGGERAIVKRLCPPVRGSHGKSSRRRLGRIGDGPSSPPSCTPGHRSRYDQLSVGRRDGGNTIVDSRFDIFWFFPLS